MDWREIMFERREVKIKIDRDACAIYVEIGSDSVEQCVSMNAIVVFDIKDGKIVGIEIVPAGRSEFDKLISYLKEEVDV